MHGAPALAPGFAALPYVNPDAPRGGRLAMGEVGTFDSLNPFVLKGTAPWAVAPLTVESLMARNWDEPFTLYGLLASDVETPPDRSWVAFTLNPAARFSDGHPVTVVDVIWSFETLGREGHPRYRAAWEAVKDVRQTGPLSLRVDFDAPNRELPLILALRPILEKAQFAGRALDARPFEPVIGSGPYVAVEVDPGRRVVFRKNPDWWGRDLPVNRGLYAFGEVRVDYYRTSDALWEAVKTGGVDLFDDSDPVRWAAGYDFPAARDGRVVKDEIANSRPTGMEGFVFNTRRAVLSDRRVREALALAYDWRWVNERLDAGAERRIRSYFDNSPLGFSGPAAGRELAILKPFEGELPEGTLEAGWRPPVSDGSGRDRANLRRAAALLDAAGYPVRDGERVGPDGRPLRLGLLVATSADETLGAIWAAALARLGVRLDVRRVDQAQFQSRLRTYDYDMTVARWAMSLSPGTEQELYFGSAGRTQPGSRNYMGVADPAVDSAIAAMLAADGEDEFRAAVHALDRVLSSGIYVVPFGYLPTDHVAHVAALHHPARPSLYGWWGWQSGPGTWWRQ